MVQLFKIKQYTFVQFPQINSHKNLFQKLSTETKKYQSLTKRIIKKNVELVNLEQLIKFYKKKENKTYNKMIIYRLSVRII